MSTSASPRQSNRPLPHRGSISFGATSLLAVALAACGGGRPVTGDSGSPGSGGATNGTGTGGDASNGSGGNASGGNATGGNASTGTGGNGSPGGAGNGGGTGGRGGATCALDLPYHFWDDGGFRAYSDDSRLGLPRTHNMSRDHLANAAPETCSREIPCNSATEVDIAEVQQALAHADVVAALAMTTKPFYGTDTRPADGTVFMLERSDKRGFSLGSGNAVPAGLRALEALLHQLQVETLASTNCANLR